MGLYITRRIILFVPIVLLIVAMNFVIVQLAPGDPALVLAGEDATPAQIERVRVKYGLDKPITVQLWSYLRKVFQGDFGVSLALHLPVIELIQARILNTLILVLSGQLISFLIGVLLGTYSASRKGSRLDRFLSFLSTVLYSIPVFTLGLLLVIIFTLNLRMFPTSGMRTVGASYTGFAKLFDFIKHLALPLSTLVLVNFPQYFQVTRTSVIEVLGSNYVITARAKGLSNTVTLYIHVLRNALLAPVSLSGLQAGRAVAGSILVETVFGWPGMGLLTFNAITTRDYPVLMGVYIVVAVSALVMNLITDLTYTALNPRVLYR